MSRGRVTSDLRLPARTAGSLALDVGASGLQQGAGELEGGAKGVLALNGGSGGTGTPLWWVIIAVIVVLALVGLFRFFGRKR